MKVDRGLVVLSIAEATGHFFHHLNLAVQAFRGGVGEVVPKIGQEVGQVSVQGFGATRHSGQLSVGRPKVPTAKVVRRPPGGL